MTRLATRIGRAAAIVTGTVVAATSLVAATPAFAATPASGSVVIAESNSALQQLAQAGIVAVPLPPAGVSYSGGTGFSATFPVTDGTGDISNFFGTIQLGGGLLIVDAVTKKAVTFHQLAFSIDNYALTGVPDDTTTTVSLLDVSGDATSSVGGVLPETLVSGLSVDPAGASYLDTALHTTKITANQPFGSLNITFTPAS
jgi:hypothetical protein